MRARLAGYALDAVATLPAEAAGHQRCPEVVGGLDEVAREDAETPRVDGKGLREAVLHAEIRDVRLAMHALGGAG